MIVKNVPISDIRPYGDNPRRNDEAVPKVAASIRRFGFQQPIVVDGNGVIIVGHTRYKAARQLGMDTVPVIYANELTPEQANEYRLADNKVGEIAEWDDRLLETELGSMGEDMAEFGFDMGDEISYEIEDNIDIKQNKIKENKANDKQNIVVTITFTNKGDYDKSIDGINEIVGDKNATIKVSQG